MPTRDISRFPFVKRCGEGPRMEGRYRPAVCIAAPSNQNQSWSFTHPVFSAHDENALQQGPLSLSLHSCDDGVSIRRRSNGDDNTPFAWGRCSKSPRPGTDDFVSWATRFGPRRARRRHLPWAPSLTDPLLGTRHWFNDLGSFTASPPSSGGAHKSSSECHGSLAKSGWKSGHRPASRSWGP